VVTAYEPVIEPPAVIVKRAALAVAAVPVSATAPVAEAAVSGRTPMPASVIFTGLVAEVPAVVTVTVVAVLVTAAVTGAVLGEAATTPATVALPLAQTVQPAGKVRTIVSPLEMSAAAVSLATMSVNKVQAPVPVAAFVAMETVLVPPVQVTPPGASALAGCTMSPSDITIATSTAAVLNPRFFRLKTVLQDYPFV